MAKFNPVVQAIVGRASVETFHTVKRECTLFGQNLQYRLCAEVGGRMGDHGDPDIVTGIGGFEVRSGSTTKNSKGVRGDRAIIDAFTERTGLPGFLVQIDGRTGPGCISGERFLEMHGVGKHRLREICDEYIAERRQALATKQLYFPFTDGQGRLL